MVVPTATLACRVRHGGPMDDNPTYRELIGNKAIQAALRQGGLFLFQ